jgi:hypothetical protein
MSISFGASGGAAATAVEKIKYAIKDVSNPDFMPSQKFIPQVLYPRMEKKGSKLFFPGLESGILFFTVESQYRSSANTELAFKSDLSVMKFHEFFRKR